MSRGRWFEIIVGIVATLGLAACGSGVQSGVLTSKFSGVQGGIAVSPTAVKLTWDLNSDVKEYEIYEASQSSLLQKTVFASAVIENLLPDTDYVFKVVGVTDGGRDGIDKEIRVHTWARFTGVSKIEAPSADTIRVSWDYAQQPLNYLVYVSTTTTPSSDNTNAWAQVTATTQQNSYTILNVQPSTTYTVVVQAQYRQNEFDRVTKSISLRSGTTFTTPTYSMPKVSIGSLPYITVNPVPDANHSRTGFRSQAYWKGNPVSDPLTGAGTLTFLASAGLPIGKVDQISLKVEYGSGATLESITISGLETYIKGMGNQVETPPVSSLAQGASYFGKVLARGDFNCDGGMDLAVGVPDIALAQFGEKAPGSGAVFIYYSKKVGDRYVLQTSPAPRPDPLSPGQDPQVIAFDDLVNNAQFGAALAAGNMNGDTGGTGSSCDDLAVGAPYYYWSSASNYTGAAFIFFGSERGLRAPSHIRDMPVNTESCDGKLQGASCAAVLLLPDFTLVPSALTGSQPYAPYGGGHGGTNSSWRFGQALSFVGDFDANGYVDLAVGAPGAPFAGQVTGYFANGGYLQSVGFVNLYPGSKFGLGTEKYNGSAMRFVTIFPPIPEEGMNFGAAIAGGGDVDGRYKTQYNESGLSGAGVLVGGADMVIGAPNFKYVDYQNKNVLKASIGTTSSSAIIQPPAGGWLPKGGLSMSDSTNYYGWPQDGRANVGAAFLYYGDSNGTSQASADESASTRNNWLSCGSRSFGPTSHFSCFADQLSFVLLFPRDANSRLFGSAVAILGDPSLYQDGTNTRVDVAPAAGTLSAPGPAYKFYSDANGDGYADILISAPASTVSSKSSVGVIHEFFGNPSRLFGATDLYNVTASGSPTASMDYSVNTASCTGFTANTTTLKTACRPTVLRTSSLAVNAQIGMTAASFATADLTGDGLLDLIVGAPGDSTVGAGSGSILVFPSQQGGGLTASYKKFYGQQTSDSDALGYSVTAGNFNGDYVAYQPSATNFATIRPLGDVFGGAPFDGSKNPAVGTVLGFLSSNFALPSVMSSSSDGNGGELVIYESQASFQDYGAGDTYIVGDVNGDGYDDAVAKITEYLPDGTKKVDAVVYFGSPFGLITTSYCLANKASLFKASQPDSMCLPSIAPSQGLTVTDVNMPQRIPRPANLPPQWFQKAVRAGDINKDGFGDVIFISSSPMLDGSGVGLTTVYFGARGGLLNVVDPSFTPSVGDPQIVTSRIRYSADGGNLTNGSDVNGFRQRDIVAVGDFNGDGYMDVAIGSPTEPSPSMNNVSGGDTHLAPSETGVSSGAGWNCGAANSSDTNCSGGSPVHDFGIVWVLYGSPRGYQTPAVQGLTTTDMSLGGAGTIDMTDTERTDAPTKPCVEVSGEASQCLVGYFRNPMFENIAFGYDRLAHSFGASVAPMRVNSDAYDDLMIGAPGFTDIVCYNNTTGPNSGRNYGRIYMLYGSKGGLVASIARDYYNLDRTGQSCPVAPDVDPGLGIMSGSKLRALAPSVMNPTVNGWAGDGNNRRFGLYMESVGDVNNDGFEDFIVSVPKEQISTGAGTYASPGAMYLYYGPLCPMDNNYDINQWFQADTGSDVNIGRQTYLNNNAPSSSSPVYSGAVPAGQTATCVRGSTAGIKPLPLKFTVLGASSSQNYGYGLSSARARKGDFNGDGIDDVLVGTPNIDDSLRGYTQLGGGVIFFGQPNGLAVADYPTLSLSTGANGAFRPLYVTPKGGESNTNFFMGNITVGDVNNDKTADYMVTSRSYSGTGSTKGIWIGTFFIFY